MTRLTLYELVIRSMRKNIKHYYLYFFALIFSTSLYFVFATLQYDSSIIRLASTDVNFSASFQAAGILLLVIVAVFIIYANSIFLNRRSKEIGLYQLIGLTKRGVARILIIENIVLGVGALLIGLGAGALVTRLFLLILMKLLGIEEVISVNFSGQALVQTAIVYGALIVLTSIQMLRIVYRSTLLQLFHAEKQGEHPHKPKTVTAAILAILGIALIAFGYYLSGHMLNDMLFLNMLGVLFSTIMGTYLLFRVTISWLFYQFRRSANGHLGLKNSLSLAPLMHRMKANANSLTLITVLSAMTLTMVAMAYSLYFSAETDTRLSLPYDYVFENSGVDAKSFGEELKREGIPFVHRPVDAVRVLGTVRDTVNGPDGDSQKRMLFLPAEQLLEAGAAIQSPGQGEAVLYDGRARLNWNQRVSNRNYPLDIELGTGGGKPTLQLTGLVDKFAMNYNVYGDQLVVTESILKKLREELQGLPEVEAVRFDTFQVPDRGERAKASALFAKYIPKDKFMPDFYTQFKAALQSFGLYIFISGFLGLVFLIATGSILYFKQMTEAEQEKRSFVTLRQLGFDVQDIMKGVVRKQLFVFAIPLLIGLLHSVFAVKAASILVLSNIVVPSAIAMGVYALIYFVFAALTIGYYKRMVKLAM
ncbi:ABC transporter permease [Paenibacillus vulneris]|uniref:FtsX-like permease family protein n=1 Tax=Paenibacillus vulneris TaxID=1133364 RepID=A0ABW3URQ7_9BACL